eukprot:scaffold178245_cov31-Tisochrysis_lutea.AAC.2
MINTSDYGGTSASEREDGNIVRHQQGEMRHTHESVEEQEARPLRHRWLAASVTCLDHQRISQQKQGQCSDKI